MVEVYVYYEGDKKLQPGLRKFLGEFYRQGTKIRLVAGGGDCVGDFITGMKSNNNAINILLKDSEGRDIQEALREVKSHDHWDTKLGFQVGDEQLHFMVQVMESWFLADRQALRSYYGQDLLESRLPSNPNVEEISKRVCDKPFSSAMSWREFALVAPAELTGRPHPNPLPEGEGTCHTPSKDDVLNGLEEATRDTKKGKYHKTRHAPDLLERMDAAKVRAAAACNRLFVALENATAIASRDSNRVR